MSEQNEKVETKEDDSWMKWLFILLLCWGVSGCSMWTPFVAGETLKLEVPADLLVPPEPLITIDSQIPVFDDATDGL